jgi:hypothetical protein
MPTFEESGLSFEFDDQFWEWVAYGDEHTDVKKINKNIQNTKSVDFIGFYTADKNTEELVLLEVKNYKKGGTYITNIEDFTQEVVQKYRDTLACALVGARNSTHCKEEWNTFIKLLTDTNKQLYAILYLEEDFSATGKNPKQIKEHQATLFARLKQKLNWLTGKGGVCIINQQDAIFQGLTINTI